MVEVFKTNVQDHSTASKIVEEIQTKIIGARANFDLEDCDRILRVEVSQNMFKSEEVIEMMRKGGHKAEVLPEKIYFI